MRVYFGGRERPNAIHTLARAGGKRVLISYAEPPTENCWKLYRQYSIELMLDSGAYSAWKRGLHIDLQDYMDYIRQHGIKQYFNLDVVGDPEATAANQATMEQAGFKPIPVFHFGESWGVLDELVGKYPLVGLGGSVGQPYSVKRRWFSEVYSRYPDGQFHALGVARDTLLLQFPFESTDSVWWLWKWRERDRRLAPGGDRKAEQAARVRHLLKLEKMDGEYQQVIVWGP